MNQWSKLWTAPSGGRIYHSILCAQLFDMDRTHWICVSGPICHVIYSAPSGGEERVLLCVDGLYGYMLNLPAIMFVSMKSNILYFNQWHSVMLSAIWRSKYLDILNAIVVHSLILCVCANSCELGRASESDEMMMLWSMSVWLPVPRLHKQIIHNNHNANIIARPFRCDDDLSVAGHLSVCVCVNLD